MLKSKKYCGFPHSHKKNHSKPGKQKNSEVIMLSSISLIWHLQVIELHPLLFVDFSALKRLREILLLCSGCALPGVSCSSMRHKLKQTQNSAPRAPYLCVSSAFWLWKYHCLSCLYFLSHVQLLCKIWHL